MNYPLYGIVGVAAQGHPSAWQHDIFLMLGVVLFFIVCSVLFAWLFARTWKRQRQTEQVLRLALKGDESGVFDWNIRTGRLKITTFGERALGYDARVMTDRIETWIEQIHPADLPRARRIVKKHFLQHTEWLDIEIRIRSNAGGWRWLHLRGAVVRRSANRRPLQMIGTYADVSTTRRREDELRLSATVFHIASEAMVITNAENSIVAVNPAFTTITGYTSDEVIGRNPRLLSAKTHSRAFYEEMWHSLVQSGAWSGEVSNRKKNGEVYLEWLSIRRVTDSNGSLVRYVAIFSDITQRKAAEERIRHLALHDALTDLPNRALLTEHIEQALRYAQRKQSKVGLIYFDLDAFKPINDTYGHEVGDLLLQTTALRVQSCVRASDTVARLGGDEFMILLHEVQGPEEALAVAQKVLGKLQRPYEIAGHTLTISGSLGVAIYPEHGQDEATLTRHADAAMYHAKKQHSQIVLYRPGL